MHGLQPESIAALAPYRLSSKPYSVSALQRFAVCPYQFLLAAIYRLEPRPDLQPLERIDPLTRGSLFHEVQAELLRELWQRRAVPITHDNLDGTEAALDGVVDRVAARYREALAPAIDRVWSDEIEALRIDLKGWLQNLAEEGADWMPTHAEFGFGFRGGDGRDEKSVPQPVTLDGRWLLHGVVDLIETETDDA
ncbi:MAG: PD-(D/E)XK nuclease family protein, partial [Acidobacteria bacterium]|nr:PD-(D/E)XK nuclease family protein [Acidobacteriota bacterium]